MAAISLGDLCCSCGCIPRGAESHLHGQHRLPFQTPLGPVLGCVAQPRSAGLSSSPPASHHGAHNSHPLPIWRHLPPFLQTPRKWRSLNRSLQATWKRSSKLNYCKRDRQLSLWLTCLKRHFSTTTDNRGTLHNTTTVPFKAWIGKTAVNSLCIIGNNIRKKDYTSYCFRSP